MMRDYEEQKRRSRELQTRLRESRRAAHQCYVCGDPLPEGQVGKCEACRKRASLYKKRYYQNRREEGLCSECGKPARVGYSTCWDCAFKRSKKRLEGNDDKNGL